MTNPITDTLWRKIYSDIYSDVATGKLAPGAVVPSLHTLMQTYKVSIGTANRAIRVLRDEGIIKTSQGHPTVVIGLPVKGKKKPVAVNPDPLVRIANALEELLAVLKSKAA